MTRYGKRIINTVSNSGTYHIRDPELVHTIDLPKTIESQCHHHSTGNQQPSCTQLNPIPTLTLTQKFEFILTLINRLLIGFITIYLCWMSLRLDVQDIPWHALLCTLGFLCLMSEGIMAYYRGNVWTKVCHRPEKARLHWMLQLCGSVIGLAGVLVKICLEEIHFHTLHGVIGLAATIILLISFLSGLISLYATELKSRLQPRFNKTFHNIIGLITFTLGMLSMYYAFETELVNKYSLDAANFKDFRQLLQIIIIIVYLLSAYGPLWCLFYSRI